MGFNKRSSFAPAEEIGDYFISVAQTYDLYPYITFNSRVISAEWNESNALWQVQVVDSAKGDIVETFVADVLINAGGILNDWAWPEIDGLQSFKGHKVHTAAWVSQSSRAFLLLPRA